MSELVTARKSSVSIDYIKWHVKVKKLERKESCGLVDTLRKLTMVRRLRLWLTEVFERYVKLNKKVPPEILTSLSGIDQPGRLADTIAAQDADYRTVADDQLATLGFDEVSLWDLDFFELGHSLPPRSASRDRF